jgi:hypothetical protein
MRSRSRAVHVEAETSPAPTADHPTSSTRTRAATDDRSTILPPFPGLTSTESDAVPDAGTSTDGAVRRLPPAGATDRLPRLPRPVAVIASTVAPVPPRGARLRPVTAST